jgi:hypothetical protein
MRIMAMRYNKKKYYRPHKEERGDLNLVVRHGSWKGIWNAETDTVELYDLGDDPDERENVSQEKGELAERMRGFARARLAECEAIAMEASSGNEPELDEETRRRLEALGYVGPATNPREQDEEQR